MCGIVLTGVQHTFLDKTENVEYGIYKDVLMIIICWIGYHPPLRLVWLIIMAMIESLDDGGYGEYDRIFEVFFVGAGTQQAA